MTRERAKETDNGIQDAVEVAHYDQMMRKLRDRGWMETRSILKIGIHSGEALEIGPGPGYLGLEWLKHTTNTTLTGLDISPAMIAVAEKNAEDYNLSNRVQYREGNAQDLPFGDNSFQLVFTNGSLHEWENPCAIFNEIYRVLKPGGWYFISDLRRDMNPLIKHLIRLSTKPRSIRPGFISSVNAAYTKEELKSLVAGTDLEACMVQANPIGLTVTGKKTS